MQKESISKRIKEAILSGEKGHIYFIKDFADYKNDALVTKVLYRLEKNKILIRLAKGIYLYPVVTSFGIYYPSLDYIAKSIANRDKAKVMPTGSAVGDINSSSYECCVFDYWFFPSNKDR